MSPVIFDRVLFLDIDGVLHSNDFSDTVTQRDAPDTFCWLDHLVEAMKPYPELKLVVHSSWRHNFETDRMLRGTVPTALAELIACCTDRDICSRFASIQAFIEKHQVQRWVILDDDVKAFPPNLPELIRCKPTKGLGDDRTRQDLIDRLREICA